MSVLVAIAAVILLVILAIVFVGVTLKLLWWALIGLVIGALGRLVLPGRQTIGILVTAALGIAAALLGGIVADALDLGGFLQFLVAVGVAALLIALVAGSDASRR